jgi:hypothetical protein
MHTYIFYFFDELGLIEKLAKTSHTETPRSKNM